MFYKSYLGRKSYGTLAEVQGNANEFIKSEEMSKPKSSKRKKPITSKKDRLQKHQKSDGNDRRDGEQEMKGT